MCRTVVFWFYALLLLSAPIAATKCPYIRYQVEGRVLPPAGVDPTQLRLLLFIEDSTRPSDYPPEEGQADYVQPERNGYFRVNSYYTTTSRYGCSRVAKSGSLIIVGYRQAQSMRKKVLFQNRQRIKKTLEAELDIGDIQLPSF